MNAILLTMALFVVSPQQNLVQDPSCDSDCVGVLEVALEWVLENGVRPIRGTGRPYVVYDKTTPDPQPADTALVAPAVVSAAMQQIAARSGLELVRAQSDPFVAACRDDITSAECRSARGRTLIQVNRLRFVSASEARVWVGAVSYVGKESGGPIGSGVRLLAHQLIVKNVNGLWVVTDVARTIVS
jgi:hypothetical protein